MQSDWSLAEYVRVFFDPDEILPESSPLATLASQGYADVPLTRNGVAWTHQDGRPIKSRVLSFASMPYASFFYDGLRRLDAATLTGASALPVLVKTHEYDSICSGSLAPLVLTVEQQRSLEQTYGQERLALVQLDSFTSLDELVAALDATTA
jgi:hypothetical protein